MRFARLFGARYLVIICLLVAALAGFLLQHRSRLDRTRVYVVGYESVPPYQIAVPGKPPSGLSADLLREAAKRKSIQLRWVQMATGPENALRSGPVDLWPIMTVLERRKEFIHFTDPYLESSDVVLLRANSPFHGLGDLDRATFALLDLAIHRESIRSAWPKARLLPKTRSRN